MTEKEPTNRELALMIESLSKTVDVGFKGVHARQDATNGKVLQNTEHRLKTESIVGLAKWLGPANVVAWLIAAVSMFK